MRANESAQRRAEERPSPSALVAGIDGVTRERGRLEAEIETALEDIAKEEALARRLLADCQRRIIALRELRLEQEERLDGLAGEMTSREWQVVHEGLRGDLGRFMERAAQVEALALAREEALETELAQPELAAAVEEHLRFRETEQALAAMPAPYREQVLTQHRRVLRRLEPYITAANAPAPTFEGPPLAVGVVAAADPADGQPEALVVVLPVPFAVYADWVGRREDLATALAYRMVASLFRMLATVGAADAPMRPAEVHGCLALQVWLGDHSVEGDLRERALEAIATAAVEGGELAAAGVELYALWLRPDLLTEEPP